MICDNDVQWECDLIILAWIFTFFLISLFLMICQTMEVYVQAHF